MRCSTGMARALLAGEEVEYSRSPGLLPQSRPQRFHRGCYAAPVFDGPEQFLGYLLY